MSTILRGNEKARLRVLPEDEIQQRVRIALHGHTGQTVTKMAILSWLDFGMLQTRIEQLAHQIGGKLEITIVPQKALKVPSSVIEQFKALNPDVVCEAYDEPKDETKGLETALNSQEQAISDIEPVVEPATAKLGKKGKQK